MYPTRFRGIRVLAGALLLAASCASAPRTSTAPPRMKDSAPEKVAAQRTAAPHSLQPDVSEDRWGLEQARERKEQQDEAAARAKADKAVDVKAPPR